MTRSPSDRLEEADEALMLRYRAGDADAFEALYQRHRGPLYRYLRRQCASGGVADELFQDVWMRLIAARARYRVEAKFTTYLYRIAHNRLVDHYRSASPAAESADALAEVRADRSEEPGTRLEAGRRAEAIRAAVRALPPDQRDAFLLQAEAGLSLEEIAETTGVGRETVKSRLRYALAKLRGSLEDLVETQAATGGGR